VGGVIKCRELKCDHVLTGYAHEGISPPSRKMSIYLTILVKIAPSKMSFKSYFMKWVYI